MKMWHRKHPRARATGGKEARERAELELVVVAEDLAATRAETSKYRDLAYELRRIQERNSLAAAFIHAAARGDRA